MNKHLATYLISLFRYSGVKAVIYFAVLTFGSFIQGVGILMLIPMLDILLVKESETASHGITSLLNNLFASLNLPMTLPVILCLYVAIVTLQSGLKRYQAVLSAEIIQGYSTYQHNRIYRSINYAQWLFISRKKRSDMTHVLTSELQKVITGTHFLIQFISSACISLIHLGLAFFISVPMTFACLCCGLFLLFLQRPKNAISYQAGMSVVQNKQLLFSDISEHLGGMKLAKSYGAESKHIDHFNTLVAEIEKQKIHFAKIRANMTMMYEVGFVIALSILFFTAVSGLHMKITELFVMIFIFSRLLPSVSNLHQSFLNIMNMLPSFNAVTSLYNECSAAAEKSLSISDEREPINHELSMRNISFAYNEVPVLNDFSACFPARKITAIAGVSGTGKTTVADIVSGLIPPDSGQLFVDNKPVNGNLKTFRNSIGYVPQATFLFHDTVRANFTWIKPDATDREIFDVLDAANASSFVRELPHGLDTVLGDRGMTLSGGERQRLAIARALLRNPSLLILDEATNAVDQKTEDQIMHTLKKLSHRLTIILISHRESTLKHADHVIFL